MSENEDSTLRDQIARRLRALKAVAGATDEQMGAYVGLTRGAWVAASREGAPKPAEGEKVKKPSSPPNKPPEEAMVRLCERSGLTMEWIYRGIWDNVPHKFVHPLKVELGEEPRRAGESVVIPFVNRIS